MSVSLVSLVVPLLGPPVPGPHGHFDAGAAGAVHHQAFASLIGAVMFLLTLLLIAGVVMLAKRGHLGAPPWLTRTHSPEHEARRILAERFARGDISSDEFLERASTLNWTPGVEPMMPHRRHRRR